MSSYNGIYFIIFLIVFVSNSCYGQVIQLGYCRNFEVVRNFNLQNFIGSWYEIERYPTWYEKGGHCSRKHLIPSQTGMEMEHTFVRDGIEYVLHVNASMGSEGVLNVNGSNIDPVAVPMSVVATDYYNYAVLYGCKQNDELIIKYVSAYILSRRRTLTEQTLQYARSVVNDLPHSSTIFLEQVSQTNKDCERYWTAHVQAEYINTD